MYAIRNKRTKRWLYGSWWQDGRVVQRTADDMVLIFPSWEAAELESRIRRCGEDYEIVPVRIEIDEEQRRREKEPGTDREIL